MCASSIASLRPSRPLRGERIWGGKEISWKMCLFPFRMAFLRFFALFCSKPREMSQAERSSLAAGGDGIGLLLCANYPARNGGKKSSLKLHLRKAALRVVWPRKRTGKAWKIPFPPAPCAPGLGDAVGHQRGRSQRVQLRPPSPGTASGIIPMSATSGKGAMALENLAGSCPLP